MKKIVLLILLVSLPMFSQDTIQFPKVDDFRRMYLEVGFSKPLGELSDKYDKSLNAGIWFRNKIKKNQFIDVGLAIDFLVKPRNVTYNHADSTVVFESSKDALKFGLRYSRIFPIVHGKTAFNIESNSGLGWSALYYRVPDAYSNELHDKLDKKTNLHTIFLSQTVKLNIYDFGIYCGYYYTPHTLFTKNYESHFGSQSIAMGVVYRL